MVKSFGKKLKQARTDKKLKQSELANKLGITNTTVSNWENNISKPDLDMLSYICGVLEVKVSYFLESRLPSDEITIGEMEHIKKYRIISEKDVKGKELVDSTVTYLHDRLQQEQERHLQQTNKPNKLHLYTYLRKIACAGTGFYFDDIPTEAIEAPYMHGTDFIIGVNGDSMEPDYHDGELLYVQKVHELTLGDTGIFMYRNEFFVKELGDKGLVSKNRDYDEMEGTEDIRLIGRVLGKVEE